MHVRTADPDGKYFDQNLMSGNLRNRARLKPQVPRAVQDCGSVHWSDANNGAGGRGVGHVAPDGTNLERSTGEMDAGRFSAVCRCDSIRRTLRFAVAYTTSDVWERASCRGQCKPSFPDVTPLPELGPETRVLLLPRARLLRM